MSAPAASSACVTAVTMVVLVTVAPDIASTFGVWAAMMAASSVSTATPPRAGVSLRPSMATERISSSSTTTVTFTAPPAVTNNNIVWVPVGWRLSDLEEEEELLDLYDFWKNGSEDDWNAAFEEFEDFLPKPEEFSPSDFGFLWIENDSADPDSAPVLMASGDDLKLTWLWEPREVYISAEAVNGTVSPGSGWYAFSVDEGDKVEFTASTDITGAAFVGWTGAPEDADAGSLSIQVQPDEPQALVANFSTDKKFYSLSFVNDPDSASSTTVVTWNGAVQNMTGNRMSKRPGYVVVSNTTASVKIDGKTLICAGWTATGRSCTGGHKLRTAASTYLPLKRKNRPQTWRPG